METLCPLLYHPLAGLTVPPLPAFIVRKYCVVKFAVYVAVPLAGAATVCDIPPASLQLAHTYCVPLAPACGVVVAIVWLLPQVTVTICGAVYDVPSNCTVRPDGLDASARLHVFALLKLPVSVTGPFMVTLAGLALPL